MFFGLGMTSESGAEEVAEGLRDIKGSLSIPFPWVEAAMGLALFLVMLSAIYLLVRHIKKRKEEKPLMPEKKISPEERALNRLGDPLLKEHCHREEWKPFYTTISETLREYITDRYQIDALDSTTSELLTLMEGKEKEVGEWEELFTKSDFVKFARLKPERGEGENFLKEAVAVIERAGERFRRGETE